MSIQVALNHKTSYSYDRPVLHSPHEIRLRPAPHCLSPILSYSLKILPENHFINWTQDPDGNHVARVVFPEPVRHFEIEVDLVAELRSVNPFDFFIESGFETLPFEYPPSLQTRLIPYLKTETPGSLLSERLRQIGAPQGRTIDFLVALNRTLQQDITYQIRLEPGVQTFEETLEKKSGSCRDTAWLLVNIARHLGFAARFVSGYLIQLKPDSVPLDGPPGPSSDFCDLHAWTEVFIPGAGWVGLDPTSGLLTSEGHLPLSAAAHPSDAAPITGSIGACEVDFAFSMGVTRIRETPRVTKPYTEEQWDEIEVLGYRVDNDLKRDQVRLWMGGEPTFVSADDRQSDEWHTAAFGVNKKRLSEALLRRLKAKFSPGAFLHYGQGKWYGGEELPRWALGCYWRKDHIPLWNEESLLGREDCPSHYSLEDANRFIQELAMQLGVSGDGIIPGYEDAWHYMLQERRFPPNLNPLESDLKDPLERKRLARVLSQGLGNAVGYCMPVRPSFNGATTSWETGRWFFREETMFLLPGDSPMGFRLPTDSLSWESNPDYSSTTVPDPFAPRKPLGDIRASVIDRRLRPAPVPQYQSARPIPVSDSNIHTSNDSRQFGVIRTALCVEIRNGHLYVFMPPVGVLESYLDLIASIEETAAALNLKVILEGYLPPADPRIQYFKITPDPGVIEVNIHPQASWSDAIRCTETLYDEARAIGLSPEKFMMDGRHSGTGGGNHITLGGASPPDSPFLRRPDLLRSLIAYWQNHPSLSMLFSGLFVGPTSQSPRIDEARHETLYEMGIAFEQMPKGYGPAPWVVDRLLRHLLADMTGNTHRSEFSIDKLYSPDTATGRQGLLEFRAFEMPPHPRMALLQQLLIRSFVARFWREPYKRPLIPWGTELHDRFMLPYFVASDFRGVLEDLRGSGYNFDFEWFKPFLEFRFPYMGGLSQSGIHLELRQAIEPWHVLGEEAGASGTSRFVDSSVERMEVRVRGLSGKRHVITANRRPLPLHPTGVPGEFVAGLRYKAWNPPSALHPTIGVQSPILLDVIDLWSGRSLGGCAYHVAHPGGRNYEVFPVNAAEAESRRSERFFSFGHTPGPLSVTAEELNPFFPFTLDLRLAPIKGKAFEEQFYFKTDGNFSRPNRLKTVS